MILSTHGILKPLNACPAEAELYFTNAGITDATEKSAWCTFIKRAKDEFGIFSKYRAGWPMLGNTASTVKYNAFNPYDTDAAHRAVIYGGWTYSTAGGAKPNGTNAYMDLKFKPTDFTGQNNLGYTFLSTTNSNGTEVEFGLFYNFVLEIRTAGTTYSRCNSGIYAIFSDSDSLGIYTAMRDNSANNQIYKNGTLKVNQTQVSEGFGGTYSFYLGAINNSGTSQYYSTKGIGLFLLHDAFTPTEFANHMTLVNQFKTTMGR